MVFGVTEHTLLHTERNAPACMIGGAKNISVDETFCSETDTALPEMAGRSTSQLTGNAPT